MNVVLWPFYRMRYAVKRLAAYITTVSEICCDCGAWVEVVWTAADPLWLAVVGKPGGVLCVRCFDQRAWVQHRLLRWVPNDESDRLAIR